MINPQAKLVSQPIVSTALKQAATRDGFGKGLVQAGQDNDQVVALCADLAESTRTHWFAEAFPDRYIEIGVAEQNLATVASGMANYGKVPFIMSYAAFSPGRNNEQIRTTISLNDVPVKIVGCHAGVSVGPDGATHQQLEDIGLMRMQPNMTVLVPCDATQAHKATVAAAQYPHPVYIRLARSKTPVITTFDTPFEIGKAQTFFDTQIDQDDQGLDIAILVTGDLVHEALQAGLELSQQNKKVAVVNFATVKPLDTNAIDALTNRATKLVTVEEHQVRGGFGSAVAEHVATTNPTLMSFVGVHDRFGQSGTPAQLWQEYGLTKKHIVKASLS